MKLTARQYLISVVIFRKTRKITRHSRQGKQEERTKQIVRRQCMVQDVDLLESFKYRSLNIW